MSTTSWLSYLNTVQPEQQQLQQFLSDDLRAQLEAWTTVAFDEASFTSDVDSPGLHTDSSKPDPSPYAKRPFGQFQSEQTQAQPSLERGFNAFSTTTPSVNTTAASAFDPDLFTNFGQIGVGVDGSNTLFPEPAGQQQQSLFNIDHVLLGQPAAPTPAPPTTTTSATITLHSTAISRATTAPTLGITRAIPFILEVHDPHTNKGTALSKICQHLNLSSKNALVFGDGENDIAMFREAGYSVAMANGMAVSGLA